MASHACIHPSATRTPEGFSFVGLALNGRWEVYSDNWSETALLWDRQAGIWLNPEDEGCEFPRWILDIYTDSLMDIESAKGFEVTFVAAEVA